MILCVYASMCSAAAGGQNSASVYLGSPTIYNEKAAK